ncbi:hypothetical protein NKI51_24040 [Mesorhizobium australicum]|uniref:hypothetical protein n=1 Tax=Mesorhizobium australicum TaxID=536018 RepID=UPI00333B069F
MMTSNRTAISRGLVCIMSPPGTGTPMGTGENCDQKDTDTLWLAIVAPDYLAHHADAGKPPNAYLQAVGCARQQDVDIELTALTALAPHVTFNIPKWNIPKQLGEVASRVVARDVAGDTPDAD